MLTDLRQALRTLAANPGFTAVVVFTMALAIGVNSTIFSVVNGVLLRPLDYAEPERLVVLFESNRQQGQERAQVSAATYLDWRERNTTFESIGAFRYRGFTLSGVEDLERIATVEVSPAVFDVLGRSAALGRVFEAADERPGAQHLVVLSHGAWRRRFASDSSVIGQALRLDDQPYTIAGVMPADFRFPADDPDVELWTPIALDYSALPSRPHRMYNAIGRLRPGVSLDDGAADMARVAAGIAAEHPDSNAGWSAALVPAHDQIVGDIGSTIWILFGAVVLVLLIASGNIANLLLARSSRASRDYAVRAAFGAGRGALVRRSVAETAVLCAAGGAAGLAVAYWGAGAVRRLMPATVPRGENIGLDPSVLAFTAAVSIGAGVLFGFVPALRAMRPNVLEVLQEGGRSGIGSRLTRRLADAMVVAEVALALVLVVGAGLLIRSFVQLTSVDPGFRTSGVTAVHLAFPSSRYARPVQKSRFLVELLDGLGTAPGLDRASAVSALPMSPLGVQFALDFTIDGLASASPTERPRAAYRGVMPGYFETIGMSFVQGRTFNAFDGRGDGQKVAIVNETLARRYFDGVDPIDRVVRLPMAGDLTIVGVVGDVRHQGLDAAPAPEIFVPYYQLALSEMQIVVRSDLEPAAVARAVRTQVARQDPGLPIGRVSSIEDLLATSIAQPRFNMVLLTALAVCAALLAAVGVYGVVTYAVTRRTAEIGVRMALGADPGRTFRHVVGGALRVVTLGVVVGLAAAAVAGQWLQSLLFGVPALDPVTFAAAGVTLFAVGAASASLPARRAARVDPMVALAVRN
jgi:putative ABC transport system permease protein